MKFFGEGKTNFDPLEKPNNLEIPLICWFFFWYAEAHTDGYWVKLS